VRVLNPAAALAAAQRAMSGSPATRKRAVTEQTPGGGPSHDLGYMTRYGTTVLVAVAGTSAASGMRFYA